MLMFGKMSVGVRRAAVVPKIRINSAMTTKVYGRRNASRTIPIMTFLLRHRVCSYCPPSGEGGFDSASGEGELPGSNSDSRVEFAIRKMHSLHLNMLDLNIDGAAAA